MIQEAELRSRIEEEIRRCHKCPLGAHRDEKGYMAVPGDGSLGAKVMFIGEAPGEEESNQGKPFVGRAGKLLVQLLHGIGLKREQVYIANILKCRPPDNQFPTGGDEVKACIGYLYAQIALVQPRVICLLGAVALKYMLGDRYQISKERGKPVQMGGVIFFPTYHPAAALRNQRLTNDMMLDFQKLQGLLKQTAPELWKPVRSPG